MKLNCKQGDLAVIVRSRAGNEGKIVKCLRLAELDEVVAQDLMHWLFTWPVWVVDCCLNTTNGAGTNLFPDERLRPLRDSDGEDEVLRLVGRPVGTPQAA